GSGRCDNVSRSAAVGSRGRDFHAVRPLRYPVRGLLQHGFVGRCGHDVQLPRTRPGYAAGRPGSRRRCGRMVTLRRGSKTECDTGQSEDYGNHVPVHRNSTSTPRNMPAHTPNPVPRDKARAATLLADRFSTSRCLLRNTPWWPIRITTGAERHRLDAVRSDPARTVSDISVVAGESARLGHARKRRVPFCYGSLGLTPPSDGNKGSTEISTRGLSANTATRLTRHRPSRSTIAHGQRIRDLAWPCRVTRLVVREQRLPLGRHDPGRL